MSEKYCMNCGTLLPESANFCFKCGKKQEMIKEIVCGKNLEEDSSDLSVNWEKGMLRPLKSVIFTAEYRDKREESGCHDCDKCDNLTCTFRQIITKNVRKTREVNVDAKSVAYSYGISQIFSGGKQGEEV